MHLTLAVDGAINGAPILGIILNRFSILANKIKPECDADNDSRMASGSENKPDLTQILGLVFSRLNPEERRLACMLVQGLNQMEICSRMSFDPKVFTMRVLELRTKIKTLVESDSTLVTSRVKKFLFWLISR